MDKGWQSGPLDCEIQVLSAGGGGGGGGALGASGEGAIFDGTLQISPKSAAAGGAAPSQVHGKGGAFDDGLWRGPEDVGMAPPPALPKGKGFQQSLRPGPYS